MSYSCRLLDSEDKRYRDDKLALIGLSKAKSERTGINHWLPPLDDPDTELVFIFERLTDGEMLGGLLVRNIREVSLVGTNPELVLAVQQHEKRMKTVGRERGISDLVGWIPKALLRMCRKAGLEKAAEAMGFRRIEDRFACFEGSTRE